MLVISKPRGAGKTTEMVKWLMSNPKRFLVVPHSRHRDLISKTFRVDRRRILCASTLDQSVRGLNPDTEFGIDDRDRIEVEQLRCLDFFKIEAYSYTIDLIP